MPRLSKRALFGKIAKLCELERGHGATIVRRCLADIQSTPEDAGYDHYRQILPAIRARLLAHKPPHAVERSVASMRELIGHSGEGARLEDVITGLRRKTDNLAASLARPHRYGRGKK